MVNYRVVKFYTKLFSQLEEILSRKTKSISSLERAYNNASNPAFKTMWLKKLYQLQGNHEKK